MKKNKRIIVLNVFIVTWVISTIVLMVSLSMVDLKLGTKLGEGFFYIKGHYKEMTEISGQMKSTTVTEQGPGIFTVPLGFSMLLAAIVFIYLKAKKKDDKIAK
ncbi:hypothetical protein CU633_21765 [Bacillus sp. V3-13]|uniref:hypothetical protein n=1 Tax=Bacillus sp. V3-13 TaxID=2053728 RepID=UPI000C768961|nr:hypothetical protein [Bacillus sp. V3-13]PLR75313.1 hypothetical protein CU633_21765 [Bacillus sp. V3-13]